MGYKYYFEDAATAATTVHPKYICMYTKIDVKPEKWKRLKVEPSWKTNINTNLKFTS